MISDLGNKTSKEISEELYAIFEIATKEISTLASRAPETIVESVHLIRKRLKFLRAFVKLTKYCSDRDTYKEINYILRDCGRLISDCRDAHVRSAMLEVFNQNSMGPTPLRARLTTLNNRQTAAIEDKLLSGTTVFEELITNLSKKAVTTYFSSLEADADSLFAGYVLCYRKSYDAFHSGLTTHEADLLHEWRKRSKDLQYQQEILVTTLPDDLYPTLTEISELCELLGKVNDLYMFSEWLEEARDHIPGSKQANSFTEQIQRELKEVLKDAEDFGESLYRYTPDEYHEQLIKTVE